MLLLYPFFFDDTHYGLSRYCQESDPLWSNTYQWKFKWICIILVYSDDIHYIPGEHVYDFIISVQDPWPVTCFIYVYIYRICIMYIDYSIYIICYKSHYMSTYYTYYSCCIFVYICTTHDLYVWYIYIITCNHRLYAKNIVLYITYFIIYTVFF